MKRGEAEKAMKTCLFDQWRKASNNDKTLNNQLSPTEYISWIRDNHPEYLKFRSRMGVTYDIEHWFDQHFGLMWTR